MQTKHPGSASPQKADFWLVWGFYQASGMGLRDQKPSLLLSPPKQHLGHWILTHRNGLLAISVTHPLSLLFVHHEAAMRVNCFPRPLPHSKLIPGLTQDSLLRAKAVEITKGKRR